MSPRSSSCLVLLSLLLGCGSAATTPGRGGSVIEVVPARPAPAGEKLVPPTVRVDASQISLGDASVGATSAIASTKRLTKIDALYDGLKRERARWKDAHPGQAFPGEYDLRIAPDTPSVVVTSVVMSSAYAGYPTARLETASGVVKLRTPVPGPPGKQTAPPKLQLEVHVTETAWELTTVPISPDVAGRLETKSATKRTLRKDPRELTSAVEQTCAGAPRCFEGLRLTSSNATAPFRELDVVLSAIAAAAKPSGSPPSAGASELELAVSFREGTGRIGGSVSGRLPPEEIQKVVRANFDVFRSCYEAGLRKDAELAGRVGIRFVIDRDGKVSWAGDENERPPNSVVEVDADLEELRKLAGGPNPNERSAHPPFPDENVRDCVIAGIRKLVFPAPEGGNVTVTYPIIFSPGD
jgi:hypothetical protein